MNHLSQTSSKNFWQNKTVFLTGHTGFKGSWLALWLYHLGANVHGYSLAPPTKPNMFEAAKVADILSKHTIADIRNIADLNSAIQESQPDIILHLAAQPIVRYSYDFPIETLSTNVMGTANLLEAARQSDTVRAIVNITSDKCYENKEWIWPYRENEALGGHDPYSSSKACAELVTAAYRNSYLKDANIAIATARAGNVIGGGDWAQDRLIPDFLKAIDAKQTLEIRSPNAIRPWQHVLEPLSGYLLLAEQLYTQGQDYASAWNFGPSDTDARSVEWIVKKLQTLIPGAEWECTTTEQPHEANHLKLDSSKATSKLNWQPQWSLLQALDKTVEWHNAWNNSQNDMQKITIQQINDYMKNAVIAIPQ